MNLFIGIIEYLNSIIWSRAMLVFIVGTGIVFSARLGFFQIKNHKDMWKSIFHRDTSNEGISVFESFCSTMAARIGTGNVAGVAVAIYRGGPGALFWMWIAGFTNSALSFVECTLGQLYKTKIDGQYRGSGAYCAERGLGWKGYAKLMSFVLMIGAAAFMPAAATFSICDSFKYSWNIPAWISALFIAVLFGIIVIGGIKRIGRFASYAVPLMTAAYLLMSLIIIISNIEAVPVLFKMIIQSAFNRGAVTGGVKGALFAAVIQGVERGTFSSAAGMGESTPAASAAETAHPVTQGLSNAAGVFLDTVIVCSATGLMILITDCFNTTEAVGGYISSNSALTGIEGGVKYVQEAFASVFGQVAPSFISVVLFFFSFTCIISYYYEAETAATHLLENVKASVKIAVTWVIRIIMIMLVFIWGISESKLAWAASDFALGACTWLNVFMLWFLFPRVKALYNDYYLQKQRGEIPKFNPDKTGTQFNGVDINTWRDIYKKYQGQ